MAERFAEVIIDLDHTQINRMFTYRIPDALLGKLRIGMPVNVPFGNAKKLRIGYITSFLEQVEYPLEKLKAIDSVNTTAVTTKDQLIELALWMHQHYGCTLRRALMTVMPVKNQMAQVYEKKLYLALPYQDEVAFSNLLEKLRKKRRTAWIRLLEYLRIHNGCLQSEIIKELKVPNATIEKMQTEGLIVTDVKVVHRGMDVEQTTMQTKMLNAEQRAAVDVFCKDYDEKQYHTYLLHGITGSGKTEVFIEMTRKVLESNRQVIVLVPEISLTYQTVRRLVNRFGNRVAIVNSKLSKGERFDQFQRATGHLADIMIGPRSALFTPFDNVGLIIIDEEHDGAYKNDNTPKFHTKDVAIKRAQISGASVVLASATPSVGTYKKAMDGEFKLLELKQRAIKGAILPTSHIVDMREEMKSGNRSIFSKTLQELMLRRMQKREQIMLFMNRRGFSHFISCRTCGEVIKCPHCDVSMTLHKDQRLYCHYCGYHHDLPKQCPSCTSNYIAAFGVGTQKLEVLTKKAFPSARVLRLDLDTSAKKNAGKEILTAFAAKEADILIGTQMIVKGHDFPGVSLVGIMAADTSLYVPDYAATERTFQLLTQAAGRAGRAGLPGDVVIQTYSPEHYAILSSANQDYLTFFKRECAYRELAKYPPYVRFMSVLLSSADEQMLIEATKIYIDTVKKFAKKGLEYIAPVNAAIYKLRDYYRKLVFLKHSDYNILLMIKKEVENDLLADAGRMQIFRNVGITYDIENG